jgi:hypothetical protein
MALAAAGQLGNFIGSALHDSLFGNPAKAAQQKAEAQQREFEQQQIAAENERKKQAAFARLHSELKLDTFDGDRGEYMLKGVNVASSGVGQASQVAKAGNALGLKLGDDDLVPQGTRAVANTGAYDGMAPNTDPMVVDLRRAPSGLASDSGGKLAPKLGDDDVQPPVATEPANTPEPPPEATPEPEPVTAPAPVTQRAPVLKADASSAFELPTAPAADPQPATVLEPTPEPKAAPATSPKPDSAVVNAAATKTIHILDSAVSSTLESLKASQSGESIYINSELSEIKAMLSIPPSGKTGDRTIRDISFGHQESAKSSEKQNVGRVLVVRNEETGEVHIDILQEQTGKAVKQTLIHIDRFGNVIAEYGR